LIIFFRIGDFANVNNTRNEKLLKKFGSRLKEIREKKNMSQEALANEANISISQISRIELGKVNATISTLDALAAALKISMRDLLNF
jgi:transcriptional regulator with XRE-family HTH domain